MPSLKFHCEKHLQHLLVAPFSIGPERAPNGSVILNVFVLDVLGFDVLLFLALDDFAEPEGKGTNVSFSSC